MIYQTNKYFISNRGNHNFDLPPPSLRNKYHCYKFRQCDQLAFRRLADYRILFYQIYDGFVLSDLLGTMYTLKSEIVVFFICVLHQNLSGLKITFFVCKKL